MNIGHGWPALLSAKLSRPTRLARLATALATTGRRPQGSENRKDRQVGQS
jgi:hypothetical protein